VIVAHLSLTLYSPHQCSFALFRNGNNLDSNALDAPYLFHDESTTSSNSNGHAKALDDSQRKRIRRDAPSKAAFGCGRRGDALKLYLVWLSKGSSHFGAQVDLAISYAQEIVKRIEEDPHLADLLEVSSRHGPLDSLYAQVCFRPKVGAHGKETTEEKSRATRHVHAALRQQKTYAVDFAPLGGGQGDFIRWVSHRSEHATGMHRLTSSFQTHHSSRLHARRPPWPGETGRRHWVQVQRGREIIELFKKTRKGGHSECVITIDAGALASRTTSALGRSDKYMRDCMGGKGDRNKYKMCRSFLVLCLDGQKGVTNLPAYSLLAGEGRTS
jgi:hypothetical protein